MAGLFEKTILAGYDVHETGGVWVACAPAVDDDEGFDILNPERPDGFWLTESAAWEACDKHRMFGHVLGARGELKAAGYSVWAPRPDATWTAKLNGEAIAESLESEVSAWEMCADHFKGAAWAAPQAVKLSTLRTVILSASHVRPETLAMLRATPHPSWPICGGLFGDDRFVLFCQEDPDDEIPADLLAVTQWAAAQGFDRIELDPEQEPTPGLEVYGPPVELSGEFLVTWAVDVEADSPQAAARKAFAMIRETDATIPDSCCVFEVKHKETAAAETVDLCDVGPGDDAVTNCRRYNADMDRLELAPNGDDYNALMDLLAGHRYRPPHKGGR